VREKNGLQEIAQIVASPGDELKIELLEIQANKLTNFIEIII